MKKILVLHGPNLNLLGQRQPSIYGFQTLEALNNELINHAQKANAELIAKQTNSEQILIEFIHEAAALKITGIILNAAAFTHTSIALRDALLAVGIPFIEVHISNIFARESFRHHSYVSDIANGVICGLGVQGYFFALTALLNDSK